MAIEKILTHKNGVAEYIITSVEDLKELVDVEVGSRARLLSPIEVRDYIYCGKWAEVKREDSYDNNEIEGIIDDINGEIMDNAVESVNEYHKNLDSLVDCTVTEFEGRDIMINPSIEGKTKNVVVKGETYQNVLGSPYLGVGTAPENVTIEGNKVKLVMKNGYYIGIRYDTNKAMFKPNTTYTLIVNILENTITQGKIQFLEKLTNTPWDTITIDNYNVGIHKIKFTTKSEFTNDSYTVNSMSSKSNTIDGEYIVFTNMLLEGDYTNSYIPPYFEGIIGVGDTLSQPHGTHKIEILSHGKNLFNESKHLFNVSIGSVSSKKWGNGKGGNRWSLKVPCKPNTTYTITKIGGDRFGVWTNHFDFDGNKEQELDNLVVKNIEEKTFTFTTPSNAKVVCIYLSLNEKPTNIHLEESPIPTPYAPYQEDKIQILLDEPLMKLPSGVCDTLEQRDDGVYLVKRVGRAILDGNTGCGLMNGLITNENYAIFELYPKDFTFVRKEAGLISDKFSYYRFDGGFRLDSIGEAISDGGGYRMLYLRILKSRLSTVDSNGLKSWLSENPITVYYGLDKPIETKLDIPTVNITTFKDVTHISTTNKVQPIINATLETINISKDANQYFNIENDKNFLLPNMDDVENNSIKELNLYMDVKGEYTLTFPSDIKWVSNVVNLSKEDYICISLKYIKVNDVGLWLGNIRGIK